MNFIELEKELVMLEAEQKIDTIEHKNRLDMITTEFMTESYDVDTIKSVYAKEMQIYSEAAKESFEKFKKIVKKVVEINKRTMENVKADIKGTSVQLSFSPYKIQIAMTNIASIISNIRAGGEDYKADSFKICNVTVTSPSLNNITDIDSVINVDTRMPQEKLIEIGNSIKDVFENIDKSITEIKTYNSRAVINKEGVGVDINTVIQKLISYAQILNKKVMNEVNKIKK